VPDLARAAIKKRDRPAFAWAASFFVPGKGTKKGHIVCVNALSFDVSNEVSEKAGV